MPTVQQPMAKLPRKKKTEMQTLPLPQPPKNPVEEARDFVKDQMLKVKPYKKLLDALDTGGMKRKR